MMMVMMMKMLLMTTMTMFKPGWVSSCSSSPLPSGPSRCWPASHSQSQFHLIKLFMLAFYTLLISSLQSLNLKLWRQKSAVGKTTCFEGHTCVEPYLIISNIITGAQQHNCHWYSLILKPAKGSNDLLSSCSEAVSFAPPHKILTTCDPRPSQESSWLSFKQQFEEIL